MAAGSDVALLIVFVLLGLLLPLGLMLILFLLSRKYRGMFDQIGFSRKELSLLLVGSLVTLLVPAQVPVVLYRNYFLAINVGGALIPTVLSIHLLRAKRIPFAAWAPGILAVSVITFLITRVQLSAGIVAEFPWMFLPSLTGATLALLLFSRSNPQAPAFAYATATIGSLVGADIFHMPELFAARQFAGSIGGASVFDLVYIAGILSLALVLLFAFTRLRQLRAIVPDKEILRTRVSSELHDALGAAIQGHYQLAAQRCLGAVQARLRQLASVYEVQGPFPQMLGRFLPDGATGAMYDQLARNANNAQLDYHGARWSVYESQVILHKLAVVERARFATIGQRALSFLVDAAILVVAVGIVAGILLWGEVASWDVLQMGLFFWAWTVQVIYFTAFEFAWKGQTPGKRILGIRVVDLNDEPPDFITSFTRNTVRILDFFLFGYLVSVILMRQNLRVQRLGDWVADTVVVPKRLAARPAPPARVGLGPQPFYTRV